MKKIDEILEDYPYIAEEIQRLNKQLTEYVVSQEETRNTLKAQIITGMPHSSEVCSNVYNAVENVIMNFGKKIQKLADRVNELIDTKEMLDTIIAQLPAEEKRILYYKYDMRYPMKRICFEMKYSRGECYRILEEAKKKIVDQISA